MSIAPLAPITQIMPKNNNGKSDDAPGQNKNTQSTETTQQSQSTSGGTTAGTTENSNPEPIAAPEAAGKSDQAPAARSNAQTPVLPSRADARSIVLAVATDIDPQIMDAETEISAARAAAELQRIQAKSQAIVDAVIAPIDVAPLQSAEAQEAEAAADPFAKAEGASTGRA